MSREPTQSRGLISLWTLSSSLNLFSTRCAAGPRTEDCFIFQKSKIPFTQDCFLSTSPSSALVHLLFVLSPFQVFCWDNECEWNSRVLHIIESPFFPFPWQVNDILAGNWVLVYFLYILFQYPLASRWDVWCQSYSYSFVDNFFFLSKTYKIFSLFL